MRRRASTTTAPFAWALIALVACAPKPEQRAEPRAEPPAEVERETESETEVEADADADHVAPKTETPKVEPPASSRRRQCDVPFEGSTIAECGAPGGCARPGSARALTNALKRGVAKVGDDGTIFEHDLDAQYSGAPKPITIRDLTELHGLAVRTLTSAGWQFGSHMMGKKRALLRYLAVADGRTFAEGDHVVLHGRLAPLVRGRSKPRTLGGLYNTGESVNCYLPGAANNDIHFNVVAEQGQTECDGIVVESIPQRRARTWPQKFLNSLVGRQVKVSGQLFFDSAHGMNPACGGEDPGGESDPRRISLWEVHPIVHFWVCEKEPCDPATDLGWESIEALAR